MHSADEQTIKIEYQSDITAAGRITGEVLTSLEFEAPAAAEVEIVVRELASNLVKHAGCGIIKICPVKGNGRSGIQIESRDSGPGIRDIERAISGGFSTAGGLGIGLGTVNRLMDEFNISSEPGKGTVIVCRKWIRKREPAGEPCPLSVGVATRSYPGQNTNGDSFVVKHWDGSVLIAVIDGLGHGQFAHFAAEKARQYVETHYDQPLAEIFRGVGRTCLATRGVVMALARFDWADKKLAFASIGDIETRLLCNRTMRSLRIQRGIVGLNAPRAVVTENPWEMGDILVMHSDGLQTHWKREDFPDLEREPASMAAQRMLKILARENDDATVIIVKRNSQ